MPAATHGHTRDRQKSPTYRCWSNMVARCTIPSAAFYEHYVTRGITVCEHWRSFENFLADMGERPAGLSIERIDNGGGYEPGNCCWATSRDQANNRTTNRRFDYRGESFTLVELVRRTGVPKSVLYHRLCRSRLPWTVEGAVKTPPLPNGQVTFYC